ncbi:PP2C family protein-serine/threonine phosphatase, partial [Mycolicibacter minnesotensis]|uniref:PP2C family protein-serine/threonine phosphatase n=1 Tax=Mycolicibacter minnesotensis TaxID=1118379 RepID=UPI0021F2E128
RNVLRAYLFTGDTPAEALDRLNDFCLHMVSRAFVTVIVARVDLGSGSVEAACAGHLIPYVARPGEVAVPAPVRLSPPIGAIGTTYEASAFTIAPGQALVMFSDGLVERRDEPIDDGIERLAETLGGTADSRATWISTAMASSETDDDVDRQST